MARFRCRACGREETFGYQAERHACPGCGSPDVQFAIGIEELPDDDPLIQAMERLAEQGGEKNDD
jgi:rRNA maturation endonuclease Nob1